MVNREQFDILKQGVKIWNQWREEHLDIVPDLSKADLSGANLQDAFLNDADVSGVKYLYRKRDQNTSKRKRFLTWLYPHSIMRGKYQGIRVASCYGNPIFKRDAEDQDFLDTLENQWK